MASLESLEKDIREIQKRNQRVELDKAWETSAERTLLVVMLTYAVVVLFFLTAKLPDPFINALIPSIAFLLSTRSIPMVKKYWIRARTKKHGTH